MSQEPASVPIPDAPPGRTTPNQGRKGKPQLPAMRSVRVRLRAGQLAALEEEASRRVAEGVAGRIDLSEVVRDMVAYWMRTEGR